MMETKRSRLPAAGILFLGLMLGIPACARKTPSGPDKPVLALVMKSLANEFFKTMEEGARQHHQERASQYDLKVVGIKNEEDVSQQIKYVETLIAQKVDAIVIAPSDSKALVKVCKQAMEAGIVVVNIDNKLDAEVLASNGIKIPFVGPDNRKGARLAGDYLARRLQAGDAVAIIEGVPNAFNGIQRKLGFEEAMKASGMNIVSSQSGYWETAKANQVAAAILTSHPALKAILCANDSMALGAMAAVKAAGKTSDVHIVGFDNIEAVQTLLREGRILATVDQHGDKLAIYGIEYALDILKGQTTPADKETPVDLITAETLR
ncbi:MAG: sugar ABC transporter substrate-binding protein [Sedimentisphaerales bacterium]|nr:sugar ABC transporter substrate-binding protein [Sedimentisphaerales bacterium]